MDKHFLDNMIFNLEERKDLKEVRFTQKAVIEVLGYLKELSKIKSEEQEEDRSVADLEAKLAESEKEKQEFLIKYKHWRTECEQLKQQLAEKEKENKKLKSENHALMSDNAYQEEDIFVLNSFKEYYNNNTIDFAVAELEIVREHVLNIGKIEIKILENGYNV